MVKGRPGTQRRWGQGNCRLHEKKKDISYGDRWGVRKKKGGTGKGNGVNQKKGLTLRGRTGEQPLAEVSCVEERKTRRQKGDNRKGSGEKSGPAEKGL